MPKIDWHPDLGPGPYVGVVGEGVGTLESPEYDKAQDNCSGKNSSGCNCLQAPHIAWNGVVGLFIDADDDKQFLQITQQKSTGTN